MIRIAGAQIPVTSNVSENIQTIKNSIDWAVENKCDYLVTPEGSLSGYVLPPEVVAETNLLTAPVNDEVVNALREIESYAKDKIGLCLGTLWIENQYWGICKRDQIRFYSKSGNLLGASSKTFTMNNLDVDILAHDVVKEGIPAFPLGNENYTFNVSGLICNDMWGDAWSDHKNLAWSAHQNFNMRRNETKRLLHLFVHVVNGGRGNEHDELFEQWHESHLRMLSYVTQTPIISVDNCNTIDGKTYEGRTSSPSGVYINGKLEVDVPRYGTQHFYYDFQNGIYVNEN